MAHSPMFKHYDNPYCGPNDIKFCPGAFCNPSIIRGTTANHYVKFPFNLKLAKCVNIIYYQSGSAVIEITVDDFGESNMLRWMLSEDETLKFDSEEDTLVQVKVLLLNDEIILSDMFMLDVVSSSNFSKMTDEFTLQCNVNGMEISVVTDVVVLSGNKNMYECRFNFDNSWKGYQKTIRFENSSLRKVITTSLTDYYCIIPEEVLSQPGNLTIGVSGNCEDRHKVTCWSNQIRIYKGCE